MKNSRTYGSGMLIRLMISSMLLSSEHSVTAFAPGQQPQQGKLGTEIDQRQPSELGVASAFPNEEMNAPRSNEIRLNSNHLMKDFTTHWGEIINPYQVLKISRDAELPVIKQAYYKLMKKYHPDLVRHRDILPGKCDNMHDVNREFDRIKLSYEILSDRKRRIRYNRAEAIMDPQAALSRAARGIVSWGLEQVGRGVGTVAVEMFKLGSTAFKTQLRSQHKSEIDETELALEATALENEIGAARGAIIMPAAKEVSFMKSTSLEQRPETQVIGSSDVFALTVDQQMIESQVDAEANVSDSPNVFASSNSADVASETAFTQSEESNDLFAHRNYASPQAFISGEFVAKSPFASPFAQQVLAQAAANQQGYLTASSYVSSSAPSDFVQTAFGAPLTYIGNYLATPVEEESIRNFEGIVAPTELESTAAFQYVPDPSEPLNYAASQDSMMTPFGQTPVTGAQMEVAGPISYETNSYVQHTAFLNEEIPAYKRKWQPPSQQDKHHGWTQAPAVSQDLDWSLKPETNSANAFTSSWTKEDSLPAYKRKWQPPSKQLSEQQEFMSEAHQYQQNQKTWQQEATDGWQQDAQPIKVWEQSKYSVSKWQPPSTN